MNLKNEKYLKIEYSYYLNIKQGNLIHIGANSSSSASMMVLESITTITSTFNLLILFVSILILSWQGTILIVLIGLFYIIATKIISSKIIFKFGNREASASSKKLVNINELISGIKIIKVFSKAVFLNQIN